MSRLALLVASNLCWISLAAAQPAPPPAPVGDEERAKIERALPDKAAVAPAKPRRLLIFDVNVGYGGHRSIAHANLAFARMGEKTGAFEAVVDRDPKVFENERLAKFDAVFLNNIVGNPFSDPKLRENLRQFVLRGGGLMGVHGTTAAFTRWPGSHEDWPEFAEMLGARGTNHRAADERVVVKVEDPSSPLLAPFGGKDFEYRDEFFRFHAPYSRERVRVLLSIDVEKTDLGGRHERPDKDYALAWVRRYGQGRVFYSTIAHGPQVFWDPTMLAFYLRGAQFVVGDLSAPTAPSPKR